MIPIPAKCPFGMKGDKDKCQTKEKYKSFVANKPTIKEWLIPPQEHRRRKTSPKAAQRRNNKD